MNLMLSHFTPLQRLFKQIFAVTLIATCIICLRIRLVFSGFRIYRHMIKFFPNLTILFKINVKRNLQPKFFVHPMFLNHVLHILSWFFFIMLFFDTKSREQMFCCLSFHEGKNYETYQARKRVQLNI